ncbi:MAG: HYR domain-containing protein, partial [Bacteroidales bacterium]|nr:HYR domain-containing protein [Bacteroidales bacterium]
SYTITNSSAFPLSGQLLNLPLPADLDNQPVAYLRWLMTENVSINNSTVTNDGTNRIDDIAVKGNFMVSSIHGADDASGVVFPLGTSFVTYTITESSGDQSWSCDFTVTVEDTQNPVIICPPPLFAYIDEDNCSTQLTLSLPFVSDNCNGPLVITYRVFNPDNSISQTYSGTQLNYTFIQGYSQIEWTVTDAAGNTDLCLQQVTIAELLPTVSAGENQVICSNQAFTISGATATNYSSIEWTTFGTGEFISGQGTLTPTYTLSAGDISAGQVVIGVTATGGCRSVSDEMVLTVWKQPEVDAGPDLSICFGENAVLTGATATDYHFLSWTSSGNGTFNYPQALNPTYTPAVGEFGAFTLTLTAIPTAGTTCIEAVSTMNLFIHSEITLNANITSNTQCNAAIGEVVLTGSEDGMVTLNGVNKPSPAIFTGLAAGYYTAYFTVANGCFVGRSFNIINVNSTLAATVEVLDPGCYGGTVTATITASGGSGVGTYIYLLNGTVSNSTGVFPGLGQGNYNVLVTDENGCTFSVAFEVDQPAQLVVQIISITNTSCDESSTGAATVNASGGTPPYYYLWNDPGAQNNLTATGLSVGNYQVTVTDANGCTASTTVFISSEGSLAINPVDDFGPFCQGELVQPIFLSTTPVNPAVVYSWTGGVDIGLPDGYASGLYPVIPSFVAADDFITREITIVAVLDDCIATTSFSVTISDTEPPLFLNCPSGETFTVGLFPGECVGSSMWSIPVAVDNCSAVIVVETSVGGPYYGAELTAGIYTITYTASDGAGNIASCTFFIEITDTEEPIIVCPGNTMVSQTDPDECHWASPAGSLTPLFVNSNCPAEVTWNVVFPLDLSQQNIVLAGWNFENPLKRVSPHLPYTADDGIVLNKDIAAIS